jgi:orotate phosphoribosyltransferase
VAKFDSEAFIRFIIDNNVVGFFDEPVTLKSGRKSNWYVNWRSVSNDVCLVDTVADFLIDFASEKGLNPDAFYGVPEGATKLGLIATYKLAKARDGYCVGSSPFPMGRGKPKEHGSPNDRFFIGEPKGRLVLVEDVTTTGGSLITALQQLQEANADIVAAVGLTNRMEVRDDGMSVAEAIRAMGVEYYALSEATKFLPEAFKKFSPGEVIGESIEAEFKKYGVSELQISR